MDLASDPKEETNLAEKQVAMTDRMEKAVKGYLGSLEKSRITGTEQELDEETVEALKNLGYLE